MQKSRRAKVRSAEEQKGFNDSRVQVEKQQGPGGQVKTARPFDKLRVTTAGFEGSRDQVQKCRSVEEKKAKV